MRLVLFQPDIAHNVGAAIRIAACFGAGVDIIEPCGFPLRAKAIRRVAMDYSLLAPPVIHASWERFQESPERRAGRLVLLTTTGDASLWDARFRVGDLIVAGRESAGAPEAVHSAADARVRIPMAGGARSLNVSVAAAVALAEARRQTGWPAR